MRGFLWSLPLLLCLSLLLSCEQKREGGARTIAYVEEILSDKGSYEMGILRAAATPKPSSDIAIIGPQTVCEALSEYLSTYDTRDNVDARRFKDGLPDFAGETFFSIADEGSFRDLSLRADSLELRRQTVLRVLAALDTLVNLSPYDMEGVAGKNRAKMLILADPYMSHYGQFDVDTLFKRSACEIELLSPLDLALDAMFTENEGRSLNVGILYNPAFFDADIYAARFAAKAKEHANELSRCFTFPVERSDSLLFHALGEFALAEGHSKLDALIVPDFSVDIDALKIELADVLSVLNESSLTLGRLISEHFAIYDALEIIAEHSYDLLRKGNLFTHNIALPQSVTYNVTANTDAADGGIILIPAFYVQN